ncbi:MAG: cation-translocating P-type ATPase [Gammaproteobacteria bacterium]
MTDTWHQRSAGEVLERLATTAAGLSAGESARRRLESGPNELAATPGRSPLRMLIGQFTDYMILVLIAAAVISGVIGDLADTIVIVVIVVLNAVIGFFQEYRAERALAALKAMAAPTATVLRGGRPVTLPASELVAGDAVLIDAGRIVPADLRLLEAASLRVNESALTGESVPVDKITGALPAPDLPIGDRRNMAFKGTAVSHGRGLGIVVETGMRTEFGRIAQLLGQAEDPETPLQRRLDAFGRGLALVVLVICGIVFVTGLLRGEPALPMFLTALSLAVAAIPEALPAVVSIALALGARRMMAQHALIRRLPAVETLGSVTVICSDKTGTLTANEMRVEQYYCDGAAATAPGSGPDWDLLLEAMTVSHDATTDEAGFPVGDPTEVALLVAARQAGRHRASGDARLPRVAELPFDSGRKCMTTLHQLADGRTLSITKGAPEVLLARCVRECRGGVQAGLDRPVLLAAADRMAADGLRVLAVGVRHWPGIPPEVTPGAIEQDLDFLGFLGLLDPPRPEAGPAIADCLQAGIVPMMITGDHPLTARAVAVRLGLQDAGAPVVTGAGLEGLPDPELDRLVRDARVYARVSPEHKLRIVAALQRQGQVVAMTGDGVNDAPALKRADIGVAMGMAGTDVAREASDMVLLDDNFATVVRAVREGRRIYDNLRRFIRYVLTTNSGEILTIFLAPLLGLPMPLIPIQILWINLLTDGLPGLALAAEPAEKNIMRRPPRPPGESVFARGLGMHAVLVGLLMAALALGAQAWYVARDPALWQTMVFTILCFAQLGHVLAVRSEETSLFTLGLLSNRPLLGAVVLTAALQLAVVYVPALNALFRTTPLPLPDLALCIAAATVILGAVELEKWARRRQVPSATALATGR